MNNSTDLNKDQILLKSLKKGENKAFEKLYRDYYKMVANFVTKNSGDETDAREHFQDILLIFLEKLRKGNFQLTAKLSTYLYRVSKNLWFYKLKKGKRLPQISIDEEGGLVIPDEEGDEVIEKKKEEEIKYKLMGEKLKELKEDCQKIIKEHFNNGRDLKGLAEEMGYTHGFIRVKKNRCLNKYRTLVFKALS